MTMILLGVVAAALVFGAILIPMLFRTVVPTNMVHVVQRKKSTTSYGGASAKAARPKLVTKEGEAAPAGESTVGNVYYKWPSWVPQIGVTVIELPVSNFDIRLDGYKAYDLERVPFELDVVSFFRIASTDRAAERISNFKELKEQLTQVLQGAVRKILASHDVNKIMVDRATFGEAFTNEVSTELLNWGVEPVKNIELMDIRDEEGSSVIKNIMAMKSSEIERKSRIEVAANRRQAEQAEIEAQREIDIQAQEALEAVGRRTAEKDKVVGVENEKSKQDVQTQAKVTREREMEVMRVAEVQKADIDKAAAIKRAEAEKETTILKADGALEAKKKEAEGIAAEGQALGEAEKAMKMAPVEAQIKLAQEIGSNEGYQQYLVQVEGLNAYVLVGKEQAQALQKADVKVFSVGGDSVSGTEDAMRTFSPKSGLAFGSMLEALRSTDQGAALLDAIAPRPAKGGSGEDGPSATPQRSARSKPVLPAVPSATTSSHDTEEASSGEERSAENGLSAE